jgi:hypothetical protein
MNPSVSVQIWRRLELFIPPLAGLAIIKGLRIQGWGALLAYLVADGGIRGVMEQVGSQVEPTEENEGNGSNQSEESYINPNLASLAGVYQIVHQIPGRIRFKIPSLKTEPAGAEKLAQLVDLDERITRVRVNRDAASVVIYYRPEIGSQLGRLPLESEELIELIQWVCGKEVGEKDGYKHGNSSLKEILEAQEQIATETKSFQEESLISNASADGCNQQPETELIPPDARDCHPLPPKCDENQEQPTDSSLLWTAEKEKQTVQKSTPAQVMVQEPSPSAPEGEKSSPYQRLKASMLTSLLKIMGNLPVSST